MSNFRVQRFGKGERFVVFGPEDEPPSTGWAVSPNGVFRDGLKVGVNAKFQIGSIEGPRYYSQIEYEPLDEA